jgi:hypothetical protein
MNRQSAMRDMTNLELLTESCDHYHELHQSNDNPSTTIEYQPDEKTRLRQKRELIQGLRKLTGHFIRDDSRLMTITLNPRRPERSGGRPIPVDDVQNEASKLMTKLNHAALGNRVTKPSHQHKLIKSWLFLEYTSTGKDPNRFETPHVHGFMIIPKVSIAKFDAWLRSEDDYQRTIYNRYLQTLEIPTHERPSYSELSRCGLLRNGEPFELPEILHQVPAFYRKKARREFSAIGITEWNGTRDRWLSYINKQIDYHGVIVTG